MFHSRWSKRVAMQSGPLWNTENNRGVAGCMVWQDNSKTPRDSTQVTMAIQAMSLEERVKAKPPRPPAGPKHVVRKPPASFKQVEIRPPRAPIQVEREKHPRIDGYSGKVVARTKSDVGFYKHNGVVKVNSPQRTVEVIDHQKNHQENIRQDKLREALNAHQRQEEAERLVSELEKLRLKAVPRTPEPTHRATSRAKQYKGADKYDPFYDYYMDDQIEDPGHYRNYAWDDTDAWLDSSRSKAGSKYSARPNIRSRPATADMFRNQELDQIARRYTATPPRRPSTAYNRGAVKETRTSILRRSRTPNRMTDDEKRELWQMEKFNRNSEPRVDTFRRSRSESRGRQSRGGQSYGGVSNGSANKNVNVSVDCGNRESDVAVTVRVNQSPEDTGKFKPRQYHPVY